MTSASPNSTQPSRSLSSTPDLQPARWAPFSSTGKGECKEAPAAALVLAALSAAALLFAPSASAQTGDRDCPDFPNQADAQHYFESKGGPAQDPDRLDGDGDGIACNSLPCPCSGTSPAPPRPPLSFRAQVVRSIDGDTIRVRRGDRHYTVRLLGIDTPELRPRECGALTAARRMARLTFSRRRGRIVRVTTDPTQPRRDRYRRLLAYVRTSSTDLSLSQLRAGWARVLVVGRLFSRLERYRAARDSAAAARRGVWGRCGGDFHRGV